MALFQATDGGDEMFAPHRGVEPTRLGASNRNLRSEEIMKDIETPILDDKARALLFDDARSQNGWRDEPVTDDQLRAIHEVMRFGPTSMNTQPMRLVFLRSAEAKERLKPALAPGNVDKTMTAPVVAIVAYDTEFYENLPRMFPHNQNAKNIFEGNDKLIQATAFRNGTLQGGYFLLAIRAVGLDAGPMSGFDNAKVDAEFFPDGRVKSNFLCGIGHGDPDKVFNRSPRHSFDEIADIL